MPPQLDTHFADNPHGTDVSVVIQIFFAPEYSPQQLQLALDEAARQV
jgi:hypothetical protein